MNIECKSPLNKEKKEKYLTLLPFCSKICQREEVAAL